MDKSEEEPRMKRPKFALDTKRVSWRSEWLSDWTCVFGDRRYSVHRVVLAGGPRACHFFAAAFDCASAGAAFQNDVTNLHLLLPDCVEHALVEDVLDFIYGEDVEVNIMHACTLLKIADVLQCPSLKRYIFDFAENVVEPPREPPQGKRRPRDWLDWEQILIPHALELGVDTEFLKLLINSAGRRKLRHLAPYFAKCPHADLRETVFDALSERLMELPCHKTGEKYVHIVDDSDVIVFRNGSALQEAREQGVSMVRGNVFLEEWSNEWQIPYYWNLEKQKAYWSLDAL